MTTLSPDHAALLADIALNRHDLTPRLIFADWLDDNAEQCEGRVEDVLARAEFIRLQVLLENLCPGAGTIPLDPSILIRAEDPARWVGETEDLVIRHRHAWLDKEFKRAGVKGKFYEGKTYAGKTYADDRLTIRLPLKGNSVEPQRTSDLCWQWRAGFLDHLACFWALWDVIGDKVHAAWPVTKVEIMGKRPRSVWTRGSSPGPVPYWRHRARLGNREPVYEVGDARTWREMERAGTLNTLNDTAVRVCLATYWPGITFTFRQPVT